MTTYKIIAKFSFNIIKNCAIDMWFVKETFFFMIRASNCMK